MIHKITLPGRPTVTLSAKAESRGGLVTLIFATADNEFSINLASSLNTLMSADFNHGPSLRERVIPTAYLTQQPNTSGHLIAFPIDAGAITLTVSPATLSTLLGSLYDNLKPSYTRLKEGWYATYTTNMSWDPATSHYTINHNSKLDTLPATQLMKPVPFLPNICYIYLTPHNHKVLAY